MIGPTLALASAVILGSLVGSTIPTRMKAPIGPDWRESYGIRFESDTPTYYVEPGPQDLTPIPADYGSFAGSWSEPAGFEDARWSPPPAQPIEAYLAPLPDEEPVPASIAHAPSPAQIAAASRIDAAAQAAQQAAREVRAEEAGEEPSPTEAGPAGITTLATLRP